MGNGGYKMNEEQKRKLEEKKYAIEAAYVRKTWEKESDYINYFEEKYGRYLPEEVSEEDRIEEAYLEMYDLEGYDEEEGDFL